MANSSSKSDYDDWEGDATESVMDRFDLRLYLRILRKYKWPITLFTAVITALAAYHAFTTTPIYRAEAQLLIERQKISNISFEELYEIDNESSDYYQTQFELLKSRNLAQLVMERLDLWTHPEFSPVAAPSSSVDEQLDLENPDLMTRVRGFLADLGIGSDPAQPGGETAERTEAVELGGDSVSTANLPLQPGATTEPGLETITKDGVETPTEQSGASRRRVELSAEQEAALRAFRSRLSISPIRRTKLVTIGFESADPVLAAQVANTIGEQYIQSYLDAKLELTTTASIWMNERLGELKVQLDTAEDRLIAYKRENNLVDVDGTVGRLNDQQLLLLTTELANARSQLASASDIYAEVQSLQGQPELLESIPAIQADPLVQRVKIEQGAMQRQLDELTNRYGERHPRVVDVQSQLASLDENLAGQVRRLTGTLAKDVQLARQRVNTLNREIAAGRSEVQALGSKTFELDALERAVVTKREIYDQFFSTITEADSADGLETANARVSDFARPPMAPIKPDKQLIVGVAAFASLVLSMLMAFLYEIMDDTVKSTDDIEQKLGIRLLGILPLIKTGLLSANNELPLNPVHINDEKGTFTEAVNSARTALVLEDRDQRRKIFVVTSSVPGEGKSTTSINLANSLGQLERVLLIDCDMRRPSIAKAADMDKNVAGLSSLITQSASARTCIKQGAFGGSIDILPSGPIPDQPLELLSSKRFEKILHELSRHYDRIVIDSAPTQAVSDALVLGRLADGVVYVVKSHDTSIELVRRGIQRLRQAGVTIVGAVTTQVDVDKLSSYGGDHYYQGYYDYYGYTEKGRSTRRPGNIRLTQAELIRIKSDDSDVVLDLDRNEGYTQQTGRDSFGVGRAAEGTAGSRYDIATPTASDDVGRSDEQTWKRVARARRPRFEDDLDII